MAEAGALGTGKPRTRACSDGEVAGRGIIAVVDVRPRSAASLDAAAVVVFAALGALSHEGSQAAVLVRTGLPFLAGWFAAAVASGLYARPSWSRYGVTWAAGTALGLALRWLVLRDAPAPAFVAVSFVTLLALTGGWRLVLLVAERWRARTA
jgi:hypothetical protein